MRTIFLASTPDQGMSNNETIMMCVYFICIAAVVITIIKNRD